MNSYRFIHWKASSPKTVHDFLLHEKKISSGFKRKIKREGLVIVNGRPSPLRKKVNTGDLILVCVPVKAPEVFVPAFYPFDVLYEDEHLLVINKPAPLLTMPGRKEGEPNLAEAVLYYLQQKNQPQSFHAVSRLDRETSGVIIIALHAYAHERLSHYFDQNPGSKTYQALVQGNTGSADEVMTGRIRVKTDSIVTREIHEEGKPARTARKTIEAKEDVSFIELVLHSGRTHQIRVHMQAAGHPLLGDTLYGESSSLINRQALHASRIDFEHPVTMKPMSVSASLPEDFRYALTQAGLTEPYPNDN
ncbi:23S rRNA pseudouridine1911/1915/1917 synthase [Sinobaca qinghaiensis]|uniref:Pseudouridine synthase n=1 Tax=Sinobaca qinghaiensis TaxID=342944 RepID=A0A419V6G4_9BACL|nr:RluA family pseudouridine synthase [Sinobaca qinghaiensis]RKD75575.1 23S rRNA pseudouridine1911/1915/1917 synthase [Sinobaca qinghaiensis]